MKLYFSKSQVPELAGLTRLQRRHVYQCGLEALLAEQPSMMWVCTLWLFGGLLSGMLASWMAVNRNGLSDPVGWEKKLLVASACGLAGAMVGAFIGAQFITARLRPYFRRVLEERKDEIAQFNAG
jgi:hypothetical protein